MSAALTNQDDFFAQTAVPERFNEKYEHMREFVSKHSAIGNRVVLVSVSINPMYHVHLQSVFPHADFELKLGPTVYVENVRNC